MRISVVQKWFWASMRVACSKLEFQDALLNGSLVLSISRSIHWLLGLPRIHSSAALAPAEDSGTLRLRRDSKAPIVRGRGPPRHKYLVNRSDPKSRSRCTSRSKAILRALKLRDSGIFPRHPDQIPRNRNSSRTFWKDRRPEPHPPVIVLQRNGRRWYRFVANCRRPGWIGAAMRKRLRRRH